MADQNASRLKTSLVSNTLKILFHNDMYLYSVAYSPSDRSKCLIFHLLADVIILTQTQLIREDFSDAAISAED